MVMDIDDSTIDEARLKSGVAPIQAHFKILIFNFSPKSFQGTPIFAYVLRNNVILFQSRQNTARVSPYTCPAGAK